MPHAAGNLVPGDARRYLSQKIIQRDCRDDRAAGQTMTER